MTVSEELRALMARRDAGELTPEAYDAAKAVLLGLRSSGPRTHVGPYRLLAKVHDGAVGAVYRARHVDEAVAAEQGGDVLIKWLAPRWASPKGGEDPLLGLKAAAVALRHPNVARQDPFEVLDDVAGLGLVVPYERGVPLSERMGVSVGPIPWEQAKPWVWQLLEGLGYLHAQGLVHRDLQPDNVLVDEGGVLKVVPWVVGLASGPDRGSVLHNTRRPEYTAPELVHGAGMRDPRADLYAVGVMLYEMLAGRLPWPTDCGAFEVYRRQASGEFAAPTVYQSAIPRHVVHAIAACLEPKPADRPSDVHALRAALEHGLVGLPTAPPLSMPVPVMAHAPRPEPMRTPMLTFAPISTPGPRTTTIGLPPMPPATMQAPDAPSGMVRVLAVGAAAGAVAWLAALIVVRGFTDPPNAPARMALPQVAATQPAAGATSPAFQSPTLGRMVYIPAGTFTMGCVGGRDDAAGGCEEGELPSHSVTLTRSFYMMEHEVTQAEWSAVMGTNPATFVACGERCPVEDVSWNDVQGFLKQASARDGVAYRLPTEAEWEYAARGGVDQAYAGASEAGSVGWYGAYDGSGNSDVTTHPGCAKARNGFGLCDMTGNVWEWTADWQGEYSAGAATDPQGSPSGTLRVTRGGCWGYDAQFARVAYRNASFAKSHNNNIGFRVVVAAP